MAEVSTMEHIHIKTKELYLLCQQLPHQQHSILLYTLQEFFSAIVALCSNDKYWMMQYMLMDKHSKTESTFQNLSDIVNSQDNVESQTFNQMSDIKTENKESVDLTGNPSAGFGSFLERSGEKDITKSPEKMTEENKLETTKQEETDRRLNEGKYNMDDWMIDDDSGEEDVEDDYKEDEEEDDKDFVLSEENDDPDDPDVHFNLTLEKQDLTKKSRRKSTPRKAITKLRQRGRPRKKKLPKRRRILDDNDSDIDMLPCADNIDDDEAKIYHCFVCETPEDKISKRVLTRHCMEEHVKKISNKMGLPCKICDKVFAVPKGQSSKGTYSMVLACLNHMVSKHTFPIPDFVKVYKCNTSDCSFMTLMKMIMKRHQERHRDFEQFGQCETCGKMMRKGSLKNHNRFCSRLNEQIPDGRQEYPCDFCDQVYKTKGSLIIHIGRKHENKQLHLCSSCPASFFAKADLERHMYSQHRVNISKRQIGHCPICNFQTLEGSLLNKHMKNHEFGTFPCEICGKVFGTENRLKSHRMTHTAEKKHQCPHCDYTTARRYHLERHLAVRHCGNQWRCDQCGFTTFTEANLHKHIDRVHNGEAQGMSTVKPQSKPPTNTRVSQVKVSLEDRLMSAAAAALPQPPSLPQAISQSPHLSHSPEKIQDAQYSAPSQPPSAPPPLPSTFNPNMGGIPTYEPPVRPYQPHPGFMDQAYNLPVSNVNPAHQPDNSILHVYSM